MSSSSLPRRAAVAVACLGATAAVGVTPALAAAVPGQNIFGSGSSLQKIAQQSIWTTTWNSTAADHSQLTNDPTATYTSSSSGAGLAEFGNTTGALDLTQDPTANAASQLDAYVGSDDPPTSADLGDASTAATGSATTAINEVTVPVAQAPVAVLLSLPKGIVVGAGTKPNLTNLELQAIWNANVPASTDYAAQTWGALLEDIGLAKVASAPAQNQFTDAGGSTGGTQSVTLQVRSSSSGTSYTFKGFLNLSNDTTYPSSFVTDDDSWPVTTTNTGNTGGSQEVADTTTNPGSVGYANTADAAAGSPPYGITFVRTSIGGTHYIALAHVQDNYPGTPAVFAEPEGGTGVANVYTGNRIDVNGGDKAYVGHWTVPKTGGSLNPTGTWGGTQASDPDVYVHAFSGTGAHSPYYPIVAATYDLGWTNYSETGSNLVSDFGGTQADAQAAGATANSLLKYITSSTEGQTDLVGGNKYYGQLPSVIDSFGVTAAAHVN
jgi:hypothetical protein